MAFERFDVMVAAGHARARFFAAISRKARAFNLTQARHGMVAADALAMAVALDSAIVVRAETHHVGIELTGALTRGATVVDWDDRLGRSANARIVLEVDQARFEALVGAGLGALRGLICR